MNLRMIIFVAAAALFVAIDAISIDHDKVQPFPQPEPVTDSEKAAVKFKPRLKIINGCGVYSAVNAAGETNGGLKGTGGVSGCKISSLRPQVYGRAAWHNDIWAIMYAWYLPKGFWFTFPVRRHDWKNVIVWIDNPALETPRMLGLSMSQGDDYGKIAPVSNPNTIDGTAPKFLIDYPEFGWSNTYLYSALEDGDFQDLIMWEQLTDAARAALETTDFGDIDAPFTDANFDIHLTNSTGTCPKFIDMVSKHAGWVF
ncbi:hypothetical protein BBO99_00009339, partial [Phytophthora kernoviae]